MKYKNEIEISGDSKKEVRVDIECLADELLNLSFNPASAADDEEDEDFERFYTNFASDVDRATERFANEMIVKHVALIGENYDADDMIDFDVEGETVSEHVSALESCDCNDSNRSEEHTSELQSPDHLV